MPALLHHSPSTSHSRPWIWRTDLSATQPFWENWFVGLSSKFLEARGGKLLLLAGTDRLDKPLMIGQMQGKSRLISLLLPENIYASVLRRMPLDVVQRLMRTQGKYQLQVFPEAGHFIHEDLPEKTAMAIVDFYKRNDRSAMVMPPKVADMMQTRRLEQ